MVYPNDEFQIPSACHAVVELVFTTWQVEPYRGVATQSNPLKLTLPNGCIEGMPYNPKEEFAMLDGH